MDILMKRGYFGFRKIGAGIQANVYKTLKDGKEYAIKVVHVEEPNNSKLNDDLKRELKIVRNLKHPNFIHVEELFRTKAKIYIIMDFMPNGTIGSEVRNHGPVCEWKARWWFCPIALAIKYLHEHKIAHSELKLDNILLDANFNPILTDFGFSRALVPFVPLDRRGRVVVSDTYCGTTSYNPPEILKEIPYDPFKGDIWCLGIMLFIILNKEVPFDLRDKEMYHNQMHRIYVFQDEVDKKLSALAKDLIRVQLTPEPDHRPSIDHVCAHGWFPIVFRGAEITGLAADASSKTELQQSSKTKQQ